MIIYEEIIRAFQRQKVRYVIVGGIAVNLLGSLRSTADLDILVELSDNNLAKVVTILKKKGYRIKQPVDPMGIADKKTRAEMTLEWESEKERLSRLMRIPPGKKLEWLRQMREFMAKASSTQTRLIRRKLRKVS